MKHCLERERLLVASGTLGTNRAWAGRRLLGIQEYRSLILKDNVQSHNSIQVAQSMWISNAPLMLQVKEMRVGQMGEEWRIREERDADAMTMNWNFGVEGWTLAECAKLPTLGVLFTLLISIQHLW